MMFVDQPDRFARFMPGFLPRPLRAAGPVEPDPAGRDFLGALRESLFGPRVESLLTADRVPHDPTGFWSECHLADRASSSQYDILRRVVADRRNLPGHVYCLALSGAGFHGQHGRAWEVEPGNLHLTVGLRCDLAAVSCGFALTMLPAVALIDALSDLFEPGSPPGGVGIKWVNDILIAGRKVGGVLTSARSQDGRIRSVVLGIGLNVRVAPEVPATAYAVPAACLEDFLSLPQEGLTRVLGLVLSKLEGRFIELTQQGSGPLLRAYRDASLVLGREVQVIPPEGFPGVPRRGRVLDIGPDLALTLTDNPEPVTNGRLVLLPR